MLNIVNLLKKNEIVKIINKKGDTINAHKREIPLSKEWYSSTYNFNKNPIRFFPALHEFVFKLLKKHFNMFNENLETKNKSREYRKVKRSLSNKVWISTPEIKHFNKRAVITIYVYNRLYNQYKKQLDQLEFSWGPIIEKRYAKKKEPIYKDIPKLTKVKMTKEIELLKHENPIYLGTSKKAYNYSKDFYIKMIKWLKLDKFVKIEQYKSSIIELINIDKVKLLDGLNLIKIERYNYLINQFKKELIYLKFKQKILFNKLKFNEMYLDPLIGYLQTAYKKKIELNIVLLKHHYYSSSILSQIITAKIINLKNRGNALRPISYSINNIYIPNLSNKKLQRLEKMSVGIQNVIFNKFKGDNKYDSLNKFLLTNKKSNLWSSKYIDNLALKNLNNKGVAGIFIKVAGRLTKRYKAQRAMKIFQYKGTLKNVYSAHRGYSSTLSRGYSNINVEKSMIHSKVRIGAFGLTGWIASY